MSNLRFIKSVTGTSVSTVNVTDVFTSDYDIYKITLKDVDLNPSGTNAQLRMRFINANGFVEAANDYDYGYHNVKSFSSFTEGKAQNTSYIEGLIWLGGDSNHAGGSNVYVFNPYNNDLTTMCLYYSTSAINTGDKHYYTRGIGMYENLARMTGFEITTSDNTIDNVKINVYGYRVD